MSFIIYSIVILLLSFYLYTIYTNKQQHYNMAKLKVGDDAPEFTSQDGNGNSVTLAQFKGKILVLYFYPKDETPGCTKEACSFRDSYEDFTKAGASVVGVSSDSKESHQKFSAKHRLPFTLLSDDGSLAKKYKVGKNLLVVPARTTFIIDQNSKIVSIHNSLFDAESHIKESLKVIEGLKSTTPTTTASDASAAN
ncbi:AhpC/TSA family protein [Cavenderia fasciculata]|uniref:thioredoxin-dependent peroxiredoxin n=1 Tax=Cavenderia fasciculata TaxID=261658 RepID=F4Q5B5_CACFS|nr:AhpC/TSA family protein [Cavenderia fasciculata]EGG17174.1 AhpC/TSA family protein [Cavenderia fasciculata]|eukprot:XP_004355658.1 AhpC/TSA family protein [Cavenderia fasciculata]